MRVGPSGTGTGNNNAIYPVQTYAIAFTGVAVDFTLPQKNGGVKSAYVWATEAFAVDANKTAVLPAAGAPGAFVLPGATLVALELTKQQQTLSFIAVDTAGTCYISPVDYHG